MTTIAERQLPVSALTPEQESDPDIGENQPPHDGSCANARCRKGPNGTRGVLKSPRAKYCCPYCRVDVCRRSLPKPSQRQSIKLPAYMGNVYWRCGIEAIHPFTCLTELLDETHDP